MKKYYNIEGMIRSGYKLSRDYETLDFSYAKFSDDTMQALAKSRSIKQNHTPNLCSKMPALENDEGPICSDANTMSRLRVQQSPDRIDLSKRNRLHESSSMQP